MSGMLLSGSECPLISLLLEHTRQTVVRSVTNYLIPTYVIMWNVAGPCLSQVNELPGSSRHDIDSSYRQGTPSTVCNVGHVTQ